MDLIEAREFARAALGGIYEESIKDAILEKVLNVSRIKFLIQNQSLSPDQKRFFCDSINEISNGKPLAYVLNEKEFWGLKFFVDERVLVPRPESEFVVERAVNFLIDCSKPKVLDVGTGSGNILLSILNECKDSTGLGVDFSRDALDVASINATKFGLDRRVKFLYSNLIDNVEGNFNVIVANLPYIGTERFNFVGKNVADYEPEIALFGGSDGLDLYRKMFDQIIEKEIGFDLMLGEFGFGQSELLQTELIKRFHKLGMEIEIIPDYAGIDRVFVVKMNK